MPRRLKDKVRTVDVRPETYDKLAAIAKREKKSTRKYVMERLDWLAIKDDLLHFTFPKLYRVGWTSEGYPIIEDKGRDNHHFVVKLCGNKLVCEDEQEEDATSCEHVKYVLASELSGIPPELAKQMQELKKEIDRLKERS